MNLYGDLIGCNVEVKTHNDGHGTIEITAPNPESFAEVGRFFYSLATEVDYNWRKLSKITMILKDERLKVVGRITPNFNRDENKGEIRGYI